jgi:hypothetical protein
MNNHDMTNNEILSIVSGKTLVDDYLLFDDEGFMDLFKQARLSNLSDDKMIESLTTYINDNY